MAHLRPATRSPRRSGRIRLKLKVNGQAREVLCHPYSTLIEVLREDLALTGTKHGCELGECGACTVVVDGRPILSCITLAVEASAERGHEIATVEGLAVGGQPSPLQEAFVETGAIQCGYCTPGMLMSASALLASNATPTEEETRRALSGNICRCSGYSKILEAVKLASEKAPTGRRGTQSGTGPSGGGAGAGTPSRGLA